MVTQKPEDVRPDADAGEEDGDAETVAAGFLPPRGNLIPLLAATHRPPTSYTLSPSIDADGGGGTGGSKISGSVTASLLPSTAHQIQIISDQ